MRYLLIIAFFIFSAGLCFAQTDAQTKMLSTPSGLRYSYLYKGRGPEIKVGNKVKVNYTGTLTNGTVFDTSEGKRPIAVKAGKGQVIKGWDEILLLLREGDEIEVIIPARLAYGHRGMEDATMPGGYRIPPGSDLKFRMLISEVSK